MSLIEFGMQPKKNQQVGAKAKDVGWKAKKVNGHLRKMGGRKNVTVGNGAGEGRKKLSSPT